MRVIWFTLPDNESEWVCVRGCNSNRPFYHHQRRPGHVRSMCLKRAFGCFLFSAKYFYELPALLMASGFCVKCLLRFIPYFGSVVDFKCRATIVWHASALQYRTSLAVSQPCKKFSQRRFPSDDLHCIDWHTKSHCTLHKRSLNDSLSMSWQCILYFMFRRFNHQIALRHQKNNCFREILNCD